MVRSCGNRRHNDVGTCGCNSSSPHLLHGVEDWVEKKRNDGLYTMSPQRTIS